MGTIHIEGLEVRCVIGVHAWERQVLQRLLVDLALELDIEPAAAGDDLTKTIDYAAVATRVGELAREGRFKLIETLAARTAEVLLDETEATRVSVTVHKPGAVRQAARVGVSVSRSQDSEAH